MNTETPAPVVVGVDGSRSALDAVRLAAREAALRRRPLRVVHAFVWPMLRVPLGPSPLGPSDGGLRNQAEQVLAEAVAEAARAAPDITLAGEIVEGPPVAVLLREARRANLIVLGNRGLGGFTGLLVGSVAVQVAAHADGPVMVCRGDHRTDGPVVVGVDGSDLSSRALGFAMEEAALRGTDVVAVRSWTYPTRAGPGDILPLVYDIDVLEAAERQALAESLVGWQERFPQVSLTQRLVRGRPGRVLVEETPTAQLIVVGARGRGGFSGLLLGSVSHAVLHHAKCPLTIVRGARRQE